MAFSKLRSGRAIARTGRSAANHTSSGGSSLPSVPVLNQSEELADTDQLHPLQRKDSLLIESAAANGNGVVQMAISRGWGWGVSGWTGGEAGKLLWEHLVDTYDNAFPEKIKKLKALAKTYHERSDTIKLEWEKMEAITGAKVVVENSDAAALKITWDQLLTNAETLHKKVTDEVPKERQKIQDDNVLIQDEQDKLDEASKIYRLVMEIKKLRRDSLFPDITDDNSAISSAKNLLGEIEAGNIDPQKFKKAKLAIASVKKIFEAHEFRLKLIPKAVSEKGVSASLENDDKKQKNLSEVIAKAKDDQLDYLFTFYGTSTLRPLLSFANATKLVEYIKTDKKDPDHLKDWYMAIGKSGKDDLVKTFWGKIKKGEENDLTTVLKKSEGDKDNKLTALLGLVSPAILAKMLGPKQGTVLNAHHLLVTKSQDKDKLDLLLAKEYAVPCLMINEDVDFLKKYDAVGIARTDMFDQLKMLAQKPLGLAAFVTAINNNTINSEDTLRAQMGTENNAKTKQWPSVTAASYSGEEGKAIKEAIIGIDGGLRPAFTEHEASSVKFGVTWHNNDGDLPGIKGGGGYTEYYVQKPKGVDAHGKRRIVKKNSNGNLYYSGNHYTSFTRIR